jgi:hypothetical protein
MRGNRRGTGLTGACRLRPAAVATSRAGAAPLPGVCQVWWVRPDDVRPEHDALLGRRTWSGGRGWPARPTGSG